MKNIKFREQLTNGDRETTLKWSRITDKDELLVEVFTTEELFEDLSLYWKDLEKKTDCKICMSYEWAYSWWQNFGKNEQRSLYILTLWDGTKLVGLAPFYKGYSAMGSSILETRLQLIGSGGSVNEQIGYAVDHDINNYLDILVDPSYIDVVTDRLAAVLTPEFLDVDTVKFHNISSESFIINHLYPELEEQTPGMSLEHIDSSSYIDLSQQELLKKYIKDQKSNGRDLQESSGANGMEKECVIKDATTSWQAVEEAMENIIESHQSDRNWLGKRNTIDDKCFKEFFRDVLKNAYRDDRLWFKQAFDDDGVYASLMAFKYNNCYYDFISEFDDSGLRLEDPANSELMINLIEEAMSDGVRKIESLQTEERNTFDRTFGNTRNWNLTVPFRKKRANILLFLNRIRAFFYKYYS